MREYKFLLLCILCLSFCLLTACGNAAEVDSLNSDQIEDNVSAASVTDTTEKEDVTETKNKSGLHAGLDYGADRTLSMTEKSVDSSSLRASDIDDTPGSYTLMIYIVGSNLESEASAASYDILEMLDSGVDPDLTNVLIYTGGSYSWGVLSGTENALLHMTKDENGENCFDILGRTSITQNMGDPSTLAAFLQFGYESYPADHYGLILWNHGGGPVLGYGQDELYEGDGLSLSELQQAMENSPFSSEAHLDWVGFDACLMASIETAMLFAPYADYFVASEESEPGNGWDYSFLSILNNTADPVKVGVELIDRYVSYYGDERQTTLSLVDLKEIDVVQTAMDEFFDAMEDGLHSGEFQIQSRIRNEVKEFAEGGSYDLVDFGNTGVFYSGLYPNEAEKLLSAIEEFVVYKDGNVSNSSGVSLFFPYRDFSQTIYDYENKGVTAEELGFQDYSEVNPSESYERYINSFMDAILNGEPADWSADAAFYENTAPEETPEPTEKPEETPEPVGEGTAVEVIPEVHTDTSDGNEYVLQLSQDKLDKLASVKYNILCERDGEYAPVLLDCEAEIQVDGTVHIAKDQRVFTLISGVDATLSYWPFTQVAIYEDSAQYRSLASSLEGPYGAFAGTDSTWVEIFTEENRSTGESVICGIHYDTDETVGGKNDADLTQFDYLAFYFKPLIALADESGALLPCSQWEYKSALWSRQIEINEDIAVETNYTSDLADSFVVQVVLCDVYGNQYASDLYELSSTKRPEEYTETIDGASCTFKLYEDHAALTDVANAAGAFTVPAMISGVPVTEIAGYSFNGSGVTELTVPASVKTVESYAFANCNTLEKLVLEEGITALPNAACNYCTELSSVVLPDSLEKIGRRCFSECSALTELEIPKNVSYIGGGAFEYCDRLRWLTVADGNCFYKIEEDGEANVLFSYDGTELVAAPSLYHSSYIIPDGVVSIGDLAFSGSYSEEITEDGGDYAVVGYGLAQIEFPATLKIIGDAAFYGCNRFVELNLPEGLESLGILAFGCSTYTGTAGYGVIELEKNCLSEIRVGADLRYIGSEAFGSYEVDTFNVHEDNWRYSAPDGRLMDKNGTEYIENVF